MKRVTIIFCENKGHSYSSGEFTKNGVICNIYIYVCIVI